MTAYTGTQRSNSNALSFKRSRTRVVGFILVTALIAFEIFNFDTTNYALSNLLGDVSFAGLKWSAVLAFAFCAIDFAGLARIFTPEQQLGDEPKEVWYLMGAWFLGATMNAVMTWWAVSVTLIGHDLGNEVLSRETLLTYVPPFVAVLVWTTRILFIGALSMAGDVWLNAESSDTQQRSAPQPQSTRRTTATVRTPQPISRPAQAVPRPVRPAPAPVQPVTQARAIPRQRMVVEPPQTLSAQPPPARRSQVPRPPVRPRPVQRQYR